MTVSFKLSLRPTSAWGMNKIYAGTHWNERKREAEAVHLLVRAAIRRQVKEGPFTKPVRVTLCYNSLLDIDNHGYLSKLIIDGMKGILIADDDRRHVCEVVQGFHSGDPKEIWVEVCEMDTARSFVDKVERGGLCAEWIPHMHVYRIYRAGSPEQTIAYEDTLAAIFEKTGGGGP